MQIFDYDDGSYLAWLVVHPDGFVVNSYRRPIPDYLILHRSTCKSVSHRS